MFKFLPFRILIHRKTDRYPQKLNIINLNMKRKQKDF